MLIILINMHKKYLLIILFIYFLISLDYKATSEQQAYYIFIRSPQNNVKNNTLQNKIPRQAANHNIDCLYASLRENKPNQGSVPRR